MKMTTLKSVAIAVGLASSAFGQATSPVVGYETLALEPGFNFIGLRLHEKPVASGMLESLTATTAVDSDVDFAVLLTAGESYVLEIEDGTGVIQVVDSWTADTLNVADLSGVSGAPSYSLRPLANLASAFGDTAAAVSLDVGSGSTSGADQVWLWNGSDFNKYYFDSAFFDLATFSNIETWVNVTGASPVVVSGSDIDLIYTDAVLVVSAAGTDVVVSGDLKAGNTEIGLVPGFNFVASSGPVGVTLAEGYGSAAADISLSAGSGSTSGADQVWAWNGSDFDKYYFDSAFFDLATFSNIETWVNVTSSTPVVVDGSTVDLPSGYLVVAAAAGDSLQSVPAFYDGL